MKLKALLRTSQLLIILGASTSSVFAGIIVFSERSAFLSLTSAIDLTGPLPNLGFRGQQVTTLGGITLTPLPSHGLHVGSPGDWTQLLPGNDIAIDDTEMIDVSFASAHSLGFDFAEPTSGPGVSGNFVDSTFTVSLLRNTSQVGQFTFNAPNDVAAFVGVWSDNAFDSIQIRETVGGIDDEYFGRFYAGVTPVPEPSLYPLAFLGAILACNLTRQFYGGSRQTIVSNE